MEKNVKFVLNDVKARAFSGSKRSDIRVSILVPLASQSNVTLHNDVLQHPDLKGSLCLFTFEVMHDLMLLTECITSWHV